MHWNEGWRKARFSLRRAHGKRWHCTVHVVDTTGERYAVVDTACSEERGFGTREEAKREARAMLAQWRAEDGFDEPRPGAVIYRFSDDRIDWGEVYRLRWRNGWMARAGVPSYGTAVGVGRTRRAALRALVAEVLEVLGETGEKEKDGTA